MRCRWPGEGARQAVQAGVAQLVEHLICNQRVGGSNPFVSSTYSKLQFEQSSKSWTDLVVLLAGSGSQTSYHSLKAISRTIRTRIWVRVGNGVWRPCRVLRSRAVCKRCTGGRVVNGSRL